VLRVGPNRAARLMNTACLIASTALVAWLVWRASRDRARVTLAALLFAASADTFATHVHLWSEATFGVWMLLTACALDAYLRDRGARRWLLAAALCAAAAMLTRYAAAALVLAAALVVLVRSPRPRRIDRAIDAVVFGLVPAVALLLWQLAVPQANAGVGQRTVEFIPFGAAKLDQCLQTFGTWIAWYAPVLAVARTTGVAAVALWIFLIARGRRAATNAAIALPWAYLAVYPPFLVVSLLFLDASTPLDLRILAPLHAMAIVVGCATLGRRNAMTAALVTLLVVAQLASTTYHLANVRYAGLGYASLRWRDNETLAFARTLPWQLPIFTTQHVALDFLLDRNVYDWPSLPRGKRARDEDDEDSADASRAADDAALDRAVLPMLDVVRAAGGRGYLVEIRGPRTWRPFLTRGQLNRYLKLRQIARYDDGRVFKIEGIVDDVRRPATAP